MSPPMSNPSQSKVGPDAPDLQLFAKLSMIISSGSPGWFIGREIFSVEDLSDTYSEMLVSAGNSR